MKIVTAAEMREIDRLTTEKYGVPSLTLMENAGTAVAEFAQKHFEFTSVCVVCGKGNNGGDGFVAARKLHEAGKQVSVIVLAKSAEELRGDAAEMFKKLPVPSLCISEEEHFSRAEAQQALQAELIVDAILGTGFKPRIQGMPAKAVGLINGLAAPILSVDVPSGVDADAKKPIESDMLVARADGVITFSAPKPVHIFEDITDGPIAVAQIGSPLDLIHAQSNCGQEVLSLGELGSAFPARNPKAHKGEFGHVLVIGGSVGKAGAAGMAGMAALATGAGLVTVACPRSVQPTVASYAPELMTEALPETTDGTIAGQAFSRLVELCEGKDSLAIGPGLSRNPETAEVIRKLVASTPVSIVLDADGLNAFAGHAAELSGELRIEDTPVQRMLVLTPHPGEMSRLAGISIHDVESNRFKVATEFAQIQKSILVLKGHRTIISGIDGSVFVNVTGNPGMAKGGSGDVLTGITAALAARFANRSFSIPLGATAEDKMLGAMIEEYMKNRNQQLGEALGRKMQPRIQGKKNAIRLLCAATAVSLHSFAGDLARSLYGEYSMTATQIIESIGEAIAIAQQHRSSPVAYLHL